MPLAPVEYSKLYTEYVDRKLYKIGLGTGLTLLGHTTKLVPVYDKRIRYYSSLKYHNINLDVPSILQPIYNDIKVELHYYTAKNKNLHEVIITMNYIISVKNGTTLKHRFKYILDLNKENPSWTDLEFIRVKK